MKKMLGLLLAVVGLGAIAFVGLTIFPQAADSLLHEASEGAKTAAANAAIEASGVKGQVSDALQSNRQSIAYATGMSLDEVDAAIASLDIESWEACTLPSDAQSTGTYEGSYNGMSGSITTYEDPGYVTIDVSGQDVTMAIPPTAQQYAFYLQYL